jgi:predicted PurR-regulated permease PerM
MIPGLGAVITWLPVGLFTLITGHVWQGFTILAVGMSVISMIDNILRPPLVGKDIQMHPIVVLFSTLGGILLFGVSGVIIGPVIAALFLSVVSIYDFYFKKELANN